MRIVALTESMFGMAAPGLVAPLEPSGFITNLVRGESGSRACCGGGGAGAGGETDDEGAHGDGGDRAQA